MEIMKLVTVICDGWGILHRLLGDHEVDHCYMRWLGHITYGWGEVVYKYVYIYAKILN